MARLRYPIGLQSFSEIRTKGYAYVDKTSFIPLLLDHGKYIFLSRPRRFGKSLMLSTLQAYFEGRRELFEGLEIMRTEREWESRPVLRFDFNAGIYNTAEGLVTKLDSLLELYESRYGLPSGKRKREDIPTRLWRLIHSIYQSTRRQIVILIDEYDKPLLESIDDEAIYELNQTLLKSFYSNLKTLDDEIEFAFITGVARFSKVSIFSDINNLDDISLENTFADICGWTHDELLHVFKPGIQELAEERGESFDVTLDALRNYYDGYRFTPKGSRLYNPFSILRALKSKEIDPYWFDSGTPTFLVKQIKKLGIFPPDINGRKCTRRELLEVGLKDINPVPLMFQTGYLTIGAYDKTDGIYELRFPNKEVEIGFFRDLLNIYSGDLTKSLSPFNLVHFQEDLREGHPEEFMHRLATLFKSLPGEDHCEAVYRGLTFLLIKLCGNAVSAENHSYKGRSDLEITTSSYIYLFEFKYNKSVKDAMEQIYGRDYPGRYRLDTRKVFIIGVNFNEHQPDRGLFYQIELLK